MNPGHAGWFPVAGPGLTHCAAGAHSIGMPLYFAYGANLDRAAMAQRCPGSAAIGAAQVDGWRFSIMTAGYATLLPETGATVHGLLWDLATADLPGLDAYEEVDAGLYRRTVLPLSRDGRHRDAAVYLAADAATGRPRPGYMEAILSAAADLGLPTEYQAELRRWADRSGPAWT